MMNKTRLYTGIILAGGKSSRMGEDKGLKILKGKPMVQYSIEALNGIVNEMIIVSDDDEYKQFGCMCVEDDIKDSGPLSGLYSGLKASKNELNIVLSCDVPLVRSGLIYKILKHNDEMFDAVLPRINDKLMPLIALYKKSRCLRQSELFLEQGEKRLIEFVRQLKINVLTLRDEKEMNQTKNINTKEEFISLLK